MRARSATFGSNRKRWPARLALAGPWPVLCKSATDLTDADHVNRQAWRDASTSDYPRHGTKCERVPYGTYQPPADAHMRRFHCRQSGRTVSLLPHRLAARLPGRLAEVEATVRALEQARTLSEASKAERLGDTVLPIFPRSLLQKCQLRCRRSTPDVNRATTWAVARLAGQISVISRVFGR